MVPYFSLFDTFMDQTSDRSSELRVGWYTVLAASPSGEKENNFPLHYLGLCFAVTYI